MANLGRMLGMLLATRMAGRGHYGSALGSAALMRGGRIGRTAGLASLGYMAYRAYQDAKARQPGTGQATAAAGGPEAGSPATGSAETGSSGERGGIGNTLGNLLDSLTGGQTASRSGQPGLGDRVRQYFDPIPPGPGTANDDVAATPSEAAPEEAAAAAAEEIDEGRALLLIRAMIAAAHADGRISPEERQRILTQIDEAGGDAEDRRLIEQELDNPKPLENLLAEVHDHETAQQFYAASRTAMDGETPVQTSYLEYLRKRLDLPPDETAEIDEAIQ